MNFLSGRAMVNSRVFKNQPRTIFVSSNPPSALILDSLSSRVRGSGSFDDRGRAVASRARGTQPMRRLRHLSDPSSTPIVTSSSIKHSTFPLSSLGRLTATLRAGAKGIDAGNKIVGGYICTISDDSSSGSQSSHFKMALAKSVTGSEIEVHSEGHRDPPNVSRKHIISSLIPPTMIHINDLAADFPSV